MRTLSLPFVLFACSQGPGSNPGIYGGEPVSASDPVNRSTVAFLSQADYATGEALVDGSGTVVADGVVVGAAHTCLGFAPAFAHLGANPPARLPGVSYEAGPRYPTLRRVRRCVAHPDYRPEIGRGEDQESTPVNDIALFFVDPLPAEPVAVAHPDSTVPRTVRLAGFGAFEGQFDEVMTAGMRPYSLRTVATFVGAVFPASRQFRDGPNPGHGSCQGDSGGSVYAWVGRLVLVGIPVSGPACSDGIGFNTDVRHFVTWIERAAGIRLDTVRLTDDGL